MKIPSGPRLDAGVETIAARFSEPPVRPVRGRAATGPRVGGVGWGLLVWLVAGWASAAAPSVTRLAVPGGDSVGFTALDPARTGLAFTNHLSEDLSLTNTIVNNGSGVACGDVDGDGFPDVYFCGLERRNALYRNLGNWRFEEVAGAAGGDLAGQWSTGAVFADTDGDGDLDLLVSGIGVGVRQFLNDGRGRFAESAEAGLIRRFGATSMALADVDGDGDLDLYVANYRTSTIMDQPGVRFAVAKVQGRFVVTRVDGVAVDASEWEGRFTIGSTGALREAGEPDVLYRNDGRGRFSAVSWTGGVFRDEDGRPLAEPPRDWGLSVLFRDLNADGAPDLYVCNDADSPDRVWINDGAGRFDALPRLALRHTSLSSMGVDAADLNRDGRDDLFVLDMLARRHEKRQTQLEKSRPAYLDPGDLDSRPQYSRNTLQIQRADGTFAEIACAAGLPAADWAWSPVFLDVDLDGHEDLLVANGFHREVEDIDVADRIRALKSGRRVSAREELRMRSLFPRWETPNLAFRNRGDLTFEEVGSRWGFDRVGVSQGMALADFDRDGDLDVVVNNLNAPAGLYRNDATAPRVAVRLRGLAPNTRGIGARLVLLGGSTGPQSREMPAGGRYLSGDEPLRVFGAPSNGPATALVLEVHWRSGRLSRLSNVVANCLYEVNEEEASPARPESPVRSAAPGREDASGSHAWFEDVSGLLRHRHVESGFDEPARQPLLPRRLGQMGPGLAWCDLDGDGRDDLVIGAARGGALGIRLNAGSGGFRAVDLPGLSGVQTSDLAGLVACSLEPGHARLFVAHDHCTSGATDRPVVLRHDLFFGNLETQELVPAQPSCVGPLALADLDGDGDLDLFAGGRVVGGRYPAAARSRLFESQGTRWEPHAEGEALLQDSGLVRGAVWTDLEADGFPELVLAREWGSIRILRNRQGRLSDWDPAVEWPGRPDVRRFGDLTGWWTGGDGGRFRRRRPTRSRGGELGPQHALLALRPRRPADSPRRPRRERHLGGHRDLPRSRARQGSPLGGLENDARRYSVLGRSFRDLQGIRGIQHRGDSGRGPEAARGARGPNPRQSDPAESRRELRRPSPAGRSPVVPGVRSGGRGCRRRSPRGSLRRPELLRRGPRDGPLRCRARPVAPRRRRRRVRTRRG
jgi:hypothetical protein